MSFESPSPAFLAGQAHGAALATQHASAPPAKPAARPAAPSKPAAPTRKPAAAKPASPGGLDLNALYAQAQKLAEAQTAAEVKAIQDQQAQYRTDAAGKATQIGAASKAAADYLSGLGDQTANSYTDAAKALGSLAGGFSGQAQTDATNAADAVQANLASLGAPAGSAKTSTGQTSSPEGLSNVLYGLGGYIPGNLLLTSGTAAAAAARQLPSAVLGAGQGQAAGAITAGNQQADTLTAQLLAAQAKTPSTTQTIYNSLLGGIKTQADLSNLAFNQRFKVGQQNERIDEFNANQTYKVNSFNATQAYRQTMVDLRQQGLTLQSQKEQDALTKAVATGAKPNAALSKLYGHIVDSNGNAIAGAGGKPIVVKASNGTKPLSATKINQLQGDASLIASNTLSGFTDAKGGKHPPLSFGQALGEMRKGTGDGQIPLPIALHAMKQAGWNIPAKYDKIVGATSGGEGGTGAAYGDSTGSLTHAGGFLPTSAPLTMGRVDQGRDIQTAAGTPIIAPGAGVVVAVKSDPGGGGAHFGPSYPVVHFTSGPYAGKTIYIGHTVAALKPGQSFNAGAVLSHTQESGPLNGGAPSGWAEIGFAPGGTPGGFGQQPPF